MKYTTYLREHAAWLVVFLVMMLTIETFLLTITGGTWIMAYVLFAMVSGYGIGTYLEYRKVLKFTDEIHSVMDPLDKKYLAPEMLGKGKTQEEREILYFFENMETSMNNEVSTFRRKSEDYKEYIETWVHEVKIPIATAKMIMTNHKDQVIAGSGIEMEMDRIESYVEQALFYARSAEVEKDYFIKPVDLEQVVNEAVIQRKRMLIAKRALVDVHDLETKREVLSDNKWISFIVGQILDNSIKYAKEESLAIEVFCEEEDNHVLLHIQDNGIGMKESEVGRVFDKGFTGSNGRSNKASTGIGLYLCKKLCKRLEHDIKVTSTEGVGTTVTIVF
ncbi:MAG: sensor histidine kinase [Eubacteriales bacterium]|nr:sensor histidine kinase [Eubacteriales bacterium]